tara:strand:+ start:602 stop:1036 length:435 start_codon:yes stop_codon:yes gene_type:complete
MIKLINITAKKLIIKNLKISSDAIGAFASGLCMLHCLATPFFFIASACSSSCCNNAPAWWQWMDYLFLAISFFAIKQVVKSSMKEWVTQGLWINWVILFFFIINVKLEWFQLAENLKFIPAFTLVFLHLYNMKYCQCDAKECCK